MGLRRTPTGLTLNAQHLAEFQGGTPNPAQGVDYPLSIRLRQERVVVKNGLSGIIFWKEIPDKRT